MCNPTLFKTQLSINFIGHRTPKIGIAVNALGIPSRVVEVLTMSGR